MSLTTTLIIYGIFLLFEALFPRKKWAMFQKYLPIDILFVAINAFFFWMIAWNLDQRVEGFFGIDFTLIDISELNLLIQGILVFLIFDFVKYWTHRFLHTRYGWWMHKTHHSIKYLHFLRALYYNPLENLVYMLSTLPILLFLNFSWEFWGILIIIDAIVGFSNHSNVKIRIPNFLAKIINTPQVHIWHHDESHPKGSRKNFGINLSLWDWVFGTLYQSDRDPEKIGS